jgi:hypothetical protein
VVLKKKFFPMSSIMNTSVKNANSQSILNSVPMKLAHPMRRTDNPWHPLLGGHVVWPFFLW